MDGSGTRQRLPGDLSTTGSPAISSQYGVTLGTTAWELDLFGRLRSLRDQALEQYLATEQARSAQTTLVASVATAYPDAEGRPGAVATDQGHPGHLPEEVST